MSEREFSKGQIIEDDFLFLISNYNIPSKYLNYTEKDIEKNIEKGNWLEIRRFLYEELFDSLVHGRGIFISGPVGTIKTSAMVFILKEIFAYMKDSQFHKALMDKKKIFPKVENLIRFWQASLLKNVYFNDYDNFKLTLNTIALGIDDIAKTTNEYYIEMLDSVLRHREMNGLSTIITSQVPIGEIKSVFGLPIYDLIRGNNLILEFIGESKRGKH